MTLIGGAHEALSRPRLEDRIDGVHEHVVRHLREPDSGVRALVTGYFNHSWAPDIVLSWDGKHEERPLYVRFGVRRTVFANDLTFLAEQPRDGFEEPVFLDLQDALGGVPDPRSLHAHPDAAPIDESGLMTREELDVLVGRRALVTRRTGRAPSVTC